MLAHIRVDSSCPSVMGKVERKRLPKPSSIGVNGGWRETGSVCIFFFLEGYPVDVPKYRSILRTESLDRVMSYDWFV